MMNRIRHKPRNAGFSLIELSIGLMILGLIMASTIQVYENYRENKLVNDTRGHRSTIDSAVQNFYIQNGFYPCPADRSLPPTDANYGKGNCPAIANNACTTNNGICRTAGKGGASDPVYIGAIPFQDLKIPAENILDGWGRQFEYVITGSQAVDQATFNNGAGAITVNDYDPNDYKNGILTPVPRADNPYQYLIISFGRDGYGAYTREGKLYQACSTEAILPADEINCRNNTSTFQGLGTGQGFATPRGAAHYDDYIIGATTVQNDIWKRAGTSGNLLPSARVGIGTPDVSRRMLSDAVTTMDDTTKFAEDAATDLDDRLYDKDITLDIKGNMGATQVDALKLCDATNANCFSPKDVGGSTPKLKCESSSGSVYSTVMSGIANGSAVCSPLPVTVTSKTCPVGQYIVGFSGGTPVCAAL